MKTLSKEELHDILYGCTVLGTGGGGSLDKGLGLIDAALAEGKLFNLVSLDELPDEAYIATPYACGAISPLTAEEEAKYAGLARIDEDSALRAFRVMESYFGKDFYGVVSTELGGGNTAVAFNVGARLGKYIVDADPAGRSVPELQHSTYYVKGLPIAPIAVANEFGDTAIIKDVASDLRAEALVRAMAVVSKNSIGVVDHPAKARDFRSAVIPGAISYALKIGAALRSAREQGDDVASRIAAAGKGFVLFRGRVADFRWETRDGFTVGDVLVAGSGEYSGSDYKLWFKNENIIAWRNGTIEVTVPDLICVLRDDMKEPVTNPNYEVGMPVSIFGLPAPAEWRTAEGLKVFGPAHFGYDMVYEPLEVKFKP